MSQQKSGLVPVLWMFVMIVCLGNVVLAGPPQIRSRVDLVVVPVSVRDADGRIVSGLHADDFTVYEDHALQTISHFSVGPEPLSVVVLVDTGMEGDILRRLAQTWPALSKTFGPEDEVATYRFSHYVTRLEDFSSDTSVIEKSFAPVTAIAAIKPAEADVRPEALAGRLPGWLNDVFGGTFPPPGNSTASVAPLYPTYAPVTKALNDAVFTAANVLRSRSVDRRKIVIVLTDGRVTGRNDHSAAEIRTILSKDQIQVFGLGLGIFQPVFKRFFSVLDSYATPTGGDVYFAKSQSDIERAFAQVVDQARNEYVLSYVSNSELPRRMEEFRSIDVRTTNAHLNVAHRSGWFPQP